MLTFGANLANSLDLQPTPTLELLGDVGAGKTTLTRALAAALGVTEPVTSPSFTISKQYAFRRDGEEYRLVHYDFYRLPDPGLMQEDLLENLADPRAVVVVEWAESVADLLPPERIVVKITTLPDNSRQVEVTNLPKLETLGAAA